MTLNLRFSMEVNFAPWNGLLSSEAKGAWFADDAALGLQRGAPPEGRHDENLL